MALLTVARGTIIYMIERFMVTIDNVRDKEDKRTNLETSHPADDTSLIHGCHFTNFRKASPIAPVKHNIHHIWGELLEYHNMINKE